MGRIVIVAYRPKPGRQQALEALMRGNYDQLRAEGLVTDRRPTLMRAADGTLVQVFEWTAPANVVRDAPVIRSMRTAFEAIADYVPLAQLPEAKGMYADFESIDTAGALFPELSP